VHDGEQAIQALREKFPGAVTGTDSFRDQHWVEIKFAQLVEVCRWLRDDRATDYDCLLDATAVHWPDDPEPIEMVYHLYSFARNDRLRIKVRTGGGGSVPTLSSIWPAANWNEREIYDMFGVRFEAHPDLRRILMPDDYTDFPLRKELPLFRG
jgi:NADH-quinone oxidoreductase subunit C